MQSSARRQALRLVTAAIAAAALVGCGSGGGSKPLSPGVRAISLPGAAGTIAFDDIVYSPRLDRVLVPARQSGLYVVDPAAGEARRLGRLGSADSADEGEGMVFVLDRGERRLTALDPDGGRVVASVKVGAPPDYVRYVAATRELWVTEPGGSPSGIETFALAGDPVTLRRTGFVDVPGGPEALGLSARRRTAYTHAGSDLVAVDVERKTVTARRPTGCGGTHGFPRVDDAHGLVLASCAGSGEVALLDLDDGRQIARYRAGGGVALPGYSEATGHFYVRGDPGEALVTLSASRRGLRRVREVRVPANGHCLTADGHGRYWTCDADAGRVLRLDDQ